MRNVISNFIQSIKNNHLKSNIMKTKTMFKIVLFAFLTLSLYSCKKEKEEKSKIDLITDHNWNWEKTVSYYRGAVVNTEDKTGYKMELKKDYSVKIYKPDGSIDSEFYWDINSDGTKLILMEEDDVALYNIVKLTEDEFVFSFTMNSPPIIIQSNKKLKVSVDKIEFYLKK